jgi:biotin carboxyl carrier protein
VAGKTRTVEIEDIGDNQIRAAVDGREQRIDFRSQGPGILSWLRGTAVVTAFVDGALPKLTVTVGGQALAVEIVDAHAAHAAHAAVAVRSGAKVGRLGVRAPIPGRLAKILVQVGAVVKAGQPLVVVEAMKMENEIRSPRDGTVGAISCAEGASVEAGQELVSLE